MLHKLLLETLLKTFASYYNIFTVEGTAASSTKNAEKKRDPEMHLVKKGNQWHFGMKCHTGVDAGSGFVHTVEATAANVHDVTVAAGLLREDNKVVYGNSACLWIEKREEIRNSPQLSAITYRINRRPGRLPKVSDNAIDWERYIENQKSSVRCKAEHTYQIVKNIFGLRKAVYREVEKEPEPLTCTFRQRESVYACQGGRLSIPRSGVLRPFDGIGCGKRGFSPKYVPLLDVCITFNSGLSEVNGHIMVEQTKKCRKTA